MIIGVLGQTLYTFLRKSEKFEILSDHGPCRGVYLDTQMRESNLVKSSCIRKGSLVWEAIFNANPRHSDSRSQYWHSNYNAMSLLKDAKSEKMGQPLDRVEN